MPTMEYRRRYEWEWNIQHFYRLKHPNRFYQIGVSNSRFQSLHDHLYLCSKVPLLFLLTCT